MRTADTVVIGGGILGLTTALELRRRKPDLSVVVLEKEPKVGEHASGRNSGVLHAGFYYSPDSLKATLCREGNRSLREYIQHKGLPLLECGKLVVATDDAELARLEELAAQAEKNGVRVELVGEAEARRIEPRARVYKKALFSPTTASSDPRAVISALAKDALAAGIQIWTDTQCLGRLPGGVDTTRGPILTPYVVGAAGVYADRVARQYGFGERYAVVPFKGLYVYSSEPAGSLKTHVYPVPDPRYPFLGVHATVTVERKVKIGPTALPALYHEQYSGLERFTLRDFLETSLRHASLFTRAGFDFRALAFTEARKISRGVLAREAGKLLDGVLPSNYRTWGKPGIRAQLIDRATRALVSDFVIEADESSCHVLNAVSPAWTSSFAFARVVADKIEAAGGPG